MRIGVTGATGFIGRYLVRQLLADGHECRCWYRPTSDCGGFEAAGRLEWIPGQLSDPAAAAPLVEGCDAVVHAALDRPGSGFRGGEGNVVEFAETNVVGTLRLIEAARAGGVAGFIFVSTCAVHEKILEDRPLDETHPLWPTSHYGAHKAAIEKFIHSYGLGAGFPICALRPCGVYGVARQVEQSKWFDLVQAVTRGETVTCEKGGKEVHARDVARAIQLLLAAENPGETVAGQAFSCCDRYVSDYEVATLAKEISGSDAQVRGQPYTPRHTIVTDKLQRLGMSFGGPELLRETIERLVVAAR